MGRLSRPLRVLQGFRLRTRMRVASGAGSSKGATTSKGEIPTMHRHRRRFRVGVAAVSALGVLTLCFTASGVAASQPEAVPDETFVPTTFVPQSLSAEVGTYVVALRGQSAAEVQADKGRKLTRAE